MLTGEAAGLEGPGGPPGPKNGRRCAMQVEILTGPDPACEAFVKAHSESRLAQLPAWSEMIACLFGHTPLYLAARGDGVEGVLPLTYVKSRLFGKQMVSQAFNDYGGILADSDEARDALFAKAVELAESLKCPSIEFRNLQPLPYDLQGRDDKVTMLLDLQGGAETVWKRARSKLRTQVRRAEKNDLEFVTGGQELLADFYAIYSRRMHELGTPAYSRKLMAAHIETFGECVRFYAVRLEGRTVGSAFTTCFNGVVEMPWSACLKRYDKLRPNRVLYWRAIKDACERGARTFDFGRSTVGGGTYEFKLQWRAEPTQLHYQYWVPPGGEVTILSPTNPKYQKKVELWRKLPYALARWLGPRVSRNLP